jgi:hypothetical protein
VVGGLSPALRGLEEHGEVRLDLGLADVLRQRPWTKRAFDDYVRFILDIGGEDAHAGGVVDHRAGW